ncbi:MAG: hypothetical protein ABR529_12960 [Actinomycetota bacterium]
MNTIVKRAAAAVAVKKVWDTYQESRRPEPPSLLSRLALPAAVLVAGGAAAYLATGGRLQSVKNRIKGDRGLSTEPSLQTPETSSVDSTTS